TYGGVRGRGLITPSYSIVVKYNGLMILKNLLYHLLNRMHVCRPISYRFKAGLTNSLVSFGKV
ncbi:hypothetical protein, partial [Bacillus smithii]|uniref:hypothetical protein n=1 Tax=Bacillus smithii TaxID=1479 RepID=UPI0022E5A6A3